MTRLKPKKNKTARKRRSEPKIRRRLRFLPCLGFYLYLAALFGVLIFTQALRSPASGVMFAGMLMLPWACLGHVLISQLFLHTTSDCNSHTAFKGQPLSFRLLISNESIFAYPTVEADLLLPDEKGVRSVPRRFRLSLSPFGSYDLADRVTFPYRGSYTIGISCLYVYDFLKFFRLRLDIGTPSSVFVMPRRLTLSETTPQAASDMNTDSMQHNIGADRSEFSDVRDYRPGDHMKTVHWQLSSKTQELMVKEYTMNAGRTVYLFVDLALPYDTAETDKFEDDINEFCADGIIEYALAAADRELNEGNSVALLYYDSRMPSGTQNVMMQTSADLNRIFKTFATVPFADASSDVTRLAVLMDTTQAISMLFVTARLNRSLCDGIDAAASYCGNIRERGAVKVIYFDPSQKILPGYAEEFAETAKSIRRQLTAGGISVSTPRLL